MKRLLPHPVLAACLLAMWLLLNQSLSPGQILLGAAVALLASHGLAAMRPAPVRIVSIRPLLRLTGIVLADVVRSNLAVARIVLFPKQRASGFVRLPLELTNVHGLTMLSCIITATPGTVWVELDRENNDLLVHVLDLVDEDDWIRLIKHRYEAPLLEIFGR